jgi:hypothetical protein
MFPVKLEGSAAVTAAKSLGLFAALVVTFERRSFTAFVNFCGRLLFPVLQRTLIGVLFLLSMSW